MVDLTDALSYTLTMLRFNGMWSRTCGPFYRGYQVLLTAILVLQTSMVFIHVINHMAEYKNDPEVVTLPGCVMIILKALAFRANMTNLCAILPELQNPLFQPRNAEQVEILNRAIKLSKKLLIGVATFYFSTVLSWVVDPLLGKDLHLPMNCWMPFGENNTAAFTSVYVYQVGALFIYTGHNTGINCFFAICMILIGAQCEILTDSLRGLKSEEVLEDCIKHYNSILRFSDTVSNAYKGILMIQFSHSVLRICIVLYVLSITNISNPQYFILCAFLLVVCGEIFFYCWFGNEMTTKSVDLLYASFENNWVQLSKQFKQKLMIFMLQLKEPIVLYAWNIFPINVVTFIKLMQKAWAFFTALSNTNNHNV